MNVHDKMLMTFFTSLGSWERRKCKWNYVFINKMMNYTIKSQFLFAITAKTKLVTWNKASTLTAREGEKERDHCSSVCKRSSILLGVFRMYHFHY